MKIFKNLKSQANEFLDRYKQKNPATYAAALQAVGAVLIADGLMGLDSPLSQNKRPGILGSLITMVFGMVFVLFPTFLGTVTGSGSMTATTTATVTNVGMPSSSRSSDDRACTMAARYVVNGKTYESQSALSSGGYCGRNFGDTIEISYNPSEPAQWMADKSNMEMLLNVFRWIGGLVVAASLVTFVLRLVSIIFGWKLIKQGRAQAKALPEGGNLTEMIDQIRSEFTTNVFGGAAPRLGMLGMSNVNPVAAPATFDPSKLSQEDLAKLKAALDAQPAAIPAPSEPVAPVTPAPMSTTPQPPATPNPTQTSGIFEPTSQLENSSSADTDKPASL